MRDLETRFEALDLVEAPYQWKEIERRASLAEKAKTPAWFHGAWVAAATAAAVLVFALGVVAGRWLLGAGSIFEAAFGAGGPLRPATPQDVSVLALVVAGGSGGTVLLASAIGLLWRWRKKNGRALARLADTETRGDEMDTLEKTTEKPERTMQQVIRNNRWLILAVVVLFAALVALGAWLLIDNLVTSDIEQVLTDSQAALNAGDVEAFMALQTEDIVLTTVINGSMTEYSGADAVRSWFNRLWDSWYSEITGELVVSNDYITFPETVGWDGQPGYEGIHINRIEDGRIAESLFIGRAVPRS